MKKDLIRDYATEAFRTYARMGCPAEAVHSGDSALVADMAAVRETLRRFEGEGNEGIVAAVRAVYFASPSVELGRGDVGARVASFAAGYHISEREVYRWLRKARLCFAKVRGMRVR